jgi:hypothetical protein
MMKRGLLAPVTVGVVLCALVALAACDNPTRFRGLQPSFEASPDTVTPGDTVEVVLVLRNGTPYQHTLHSGSTCLFSLRTLRGDESVWFGGQDYACAFTLTDFTIPPRDSLFFVRKLIAAPVAGTYVIQAIMQVDLPDLETEVTVAASLGGN